MRVVTAAFCMSMFLSISNLYADYPIINICTGVACNKTNAETDGSTVVWEDYRHGSTDPEIYWVSLSDPNLVKNRIQLTGKQYDPAVWGNQIVLQNDYVTSNKEINVYQIPGPGVQALSDSAHQRNPDISEGVIVCGSMNSGFYNVAIWNPANSRYDFVAPNGATQTEVYLNWPVVVWQDFRTTDPKIYRCDLSVLPYSAAAVYPSGGYQQHPVASGNRVVWQDIVANTATLICFDVSRQEIIWTRSLTGSQQTYMSMSGDILVWQELRAGYSDYNIYGHDFGTGGDLYIATGSQNDERPAISGRTVVWHRAVGTNWDILGTVIPSPAVIAVTSPNGGEMFLAGTDIEVDWQMTAGNAPAAVNVEFSADGGSNWSVIGPGVPFAEPFVWTSPADSNSLECLMRVQATDDLQIVDRSDVAFTIFQCDLRLTADLTGDCFVGIEDFAEFALQWLTCGNQYDAGWCTN